MKRFGVRNHERWGLLIKTWATGKNYIGGNPDERAKAPYDMLPGTVEKFVEIITLAGVGPVNVDLLTDISFTRLTGPGSIVIRLATPEMIAESEDHLVNGPVYGLPAFYSSMFQGAPVERPLTDPEKMKFHATRIGDYTLSVCQ